MTLNCNRVKRTSPTPHHILSTERTTDDSSNDNEPDTAAPMLRRSERVNKGQRNDTWYMGDGRGSLPVGAGAALIATEMQEPVGNAWISQHPF